MVEFQRTINPVQAIFVFTLMVICLSIAGCSEESTTTQKQTSSTEPPLHIDIAIYSTEISSAIIDHFQSISDGKVDDIYASSSSKLQQAVSLDEFRNYCDKINLRLGTLQDHRIRESQFVPQEGRIIATAVCEADFSQGTGVMTVLYEQDEGHWKLMRLNVNAPELLDNPDDYRELKQIMVEQSDPVEPGQQVDVWDASTNPPQKIMEAVSVTYVRWKVSGPFTSAKYPAKGFVTLSLSTEQTKSLENVDTISIRRISE